MKLFISFLWTSMVLLGTPMTLPVPNNQDRSAFLDSSVSGIWGNNENPSEELIGSAFGGIWTKQGELAGSNGANDLLAINVLSGEWGGIPVSGTWSIDPSFWTTYARAVISMHIGHGGGDPDYFAWLITPGATSGTWGLVRNSGKGGGLSNMKLWGSGTPEKRVPDDGSSLVMLLLGLMVVGFFRRFRSRS